MTEYETYLLIHLLVALFSTLFIMRMHYMDVGRVTVLDILICGFLNLIPLIGWCLTLTMLWAYKDDAMFEKDFL